MVKTIKTLRRYSIIKKKVKLNLKFIYRDYIITFLPWFVSSQTTPLARQRDIEKLLLIVFDVSLTYFNRLYGIRNSLFLLPVVRRVSE